MATATLKPVSKTAFLTDFLHENPQGNATAANKAWNEAGHSGTISPTLVSKLRKELGLVGNVWKTGRKKSKVNATASAAAKVSTKPSDRAAKPTTSSKRGRSQGKSAFIKELLYDNPRANAATVNEEWTKAGMPGKISQTLVSNVRSALGFAGNLRATSETKAKAGTKADAPAKARLGRPTDRAKVLAEIEGELDTLIYKLMGLGGLSKAEDDLRRARRVLCRSHGE